MERRGIATVTISMLRWITEKVCPPRNLHVPFPLGFPLGRPNDPALQKRVIVRALEIVSDPTARPGVIRDFESE